MGYGFVSELRHIRMIGFGGVTVDPSTNFVIKEITPDGEVTTPGYEQVVLYKRGNPGE